MRICRAHVKRFAKFFMVFLPLFCHWPMIGQNQVWQVYQLGHKFGLNDIGLSSKVWHNILLYAPVFVYVLIFLSVLIF